MTLYFEWEYSFYIQAGLLIPGVIGILLTPKKFLDIDSAIIYKGKIANRVYEDYGITDLMAEEIIVPGATKAIGFFPRAAPNLDDMEEDKMDEQMDQMESPRRARRLNSSRSNIPASDIHVVPPEESYGEVIKILLLNKTFVFLLLTITGYFYIVAGI